MKGKSQWPVMESVVALLGQPVVVQAVALVALAFLLAGCGAAAGEYRLSASLWIPGEPVQPVLLEQRALDSSPPLRLGELSFK